MVRELRLRGERPHGQVRLVLQQRPRQAEKKKIIAREHGYHGIAVSSGSLTGLPAMHKGFDLPIPNILHTGSHNWYRDSHPGESEEAFASRRAEELEQLILAEGPETVAAFVAEPVLGAGGAVLPPKTYFEKIQAVLAKYDVLMVADEVITGFFRTGNRFACETFGIRPDIMCIAKQLSSAYLPISAVILNEKVYGPIGSSPAGTASSAPASPTPATRCRPRWRWRH